ncbi:MAG: hypothetical protein ABI045_07300 [Flavobacteriales bacterium]
MALSLITLGLFQAFFAWYFYLRLWPDYFIGLAVFSFIELGWNFYGGYRKEKFYQNMIGLVYFIMPPPWKFFIRSVR